MSPDRPPTARRPPDDGLRTVPHVRRPDGRLQLGVGPGAWLVEGWRPSAGTSDHDPTSALVHSLVGAGAEPRRPVVHPFLVQGQDPLAQLLRERLPLALAAGHRAAPAGRLPGARTPGTVVVLVSPYAVPVGTARRPDLAGCTVLPVVPQTSRVVVGPVCGHATTACLHCLDLHRRDHDAHWPALAAVLDDPLTGAAPPRHSTGVLEVTVALTSLLVGALCRGEEVERGRALEIGPRVPHVVSRRWSRHPACPWHASVAAS